MFKRRYIQPTEDELMEVDLINWFVLSEKFLFYSLSCKEQVFSLFLKLSDYRHSESQFKQEKKCVCYIVFIKIKLGYV